jgi:Cyclic nucleotide-binding domain
MRLGFATGLSHYDSPPPDCVGDLAALRAADAFRFANVLSAWAEFEAGTVVSYGQDGGVVMGATTVGLGPMDVTFAAVAMPELRGEPEVGDGWVRFTQTTGGRTGVPLPRRINRPPFLRLQSPLVWTTLRLTLLADGPPEIELIGASPFPRHWVYGPTGRLALKAGVAEWRRWLGQPSWTATPWGNEDSPIVVAEAESGLERGLSALLMHGSHKPRIRSLATGEVLAAQGEPGASLYLVLDGMLAVTVDGKDLGEVGPGAVLGERAILESSPRTATLTARTRVKIAEAPADTINRSALASLARLHRREAPGLTQQEPASHTSPPPAPTSMSRSITIAE